MEHLELLKEIISNQLDIDPEDVTPEKSLQNDLNCDSLDLVEIVMALEEELGVSVPDEDFEDLEQNVTVGKILELIDNLT